MGNEKYKKTVTWQKVGLSILCGVLALVLIFLIFGTVYAHYLLSLVAADPNGDHNDTLSPEDLATATGETIHDDYTGPTMHEDDVTMETIHPDDIDKDHDGVVNIMLIGEDRRPGEPRQRSDSMILCSFNTNTGDLTMISFLRDSYVAIPGYKKAKMNAAYQRGGPALLGQTVAINFGVHVDASIMIQFDGFQKVIDLLGGVDINLTKKEADHLNSEYNWSLSPGMNHLNGEEALHYSRIRAIDMDARRAERQRKVLTSLINAYKNKGITEMVGIATDILQAGLVQTDMSSDEIINYIWQLFPMLAGAEIKNQQIPANGTWTESAVGKLAYCKIIDFDVNRKILQEIMGS